MDKKYLILLPLAVPLFFGGKAAITAIKKKKMASHKGNGDTESSIALTPGSPDADVMGSEAHSDNLRTATQIPEIKEEMSPSSADLVNIDAEIPVEETDPSEKENTPQGAKDNLSTLDDNLEEKTIFTGPKGGKYYYNDKGKKIYLK
jgi:hypothetical protein